MNNIHKLSHSDLTFVLHNISTRSGLLVVEIEWMCIAIYMCVCYVYAQVSIDLIKDIRDLPPLCQGRLHQETSCNPKFHLKANPMLSSTNNQLTTDLPHFFLPAPTQGSYPQAHPKQPNTLQPTKLSQRHIPPPLLCESRTIQQLQKHSPNVGKLLESSTSVYNQPPVIRLLFALLSFRCVSQEHCNDDTLRTDFRLMSASYTLIQHVQKLENLQDKPKPGSFEVFIVCVTKLWSRHLNYIISYQLPPPEMKLS